MSTVLSKDQMLAMVHRIFRKDRFHIDLFDAIGYGLDTTRDRADEAYDQQFADTATYMLPIYEAQLLLSGEGKSLDDRRAAVIAGWQRGGKVDIIQIQAAANSWRNGATEVDFIGGRIVVRFVSEFGIPTDLEGLKAAIDVIKPAHLGIEYIFKYLLIEDIHEVKTLEQMESLTLEQFAFGRE